MDYISTKEAAEKRRIKGAIKVGMVWVIPSMAVKPADNRKKTND